MLYAKSMKRFVKFAQMESWRPVGLGLKLKRKRAGHDGTFYARLMLFLGSMMGKRVGKAECRRAHACTVAQLPRSHIAPQNATIRNLW